MTGAIALGFALSMLFGVILWFGGWGPGLLMALVGAVGTAIFYPKTYYYCMKCDQYVGTGPAYCDRCGSNRSYTREGK